MDDIMYIRIMGYSEQANIAINKAIRFSDSEKCEKVNCVHLFLGLLELTKLGEAIIEDLGTTFDMIYSSYQNLAGTGIYGELDTSDTEFDLGYFSPDALQIVTYGTTYAFKNRKNISCEILMQALINQESPELDDFLSYIGTSFEAISKLQVEDFDIPEELSKFVEDLSTSKVLEEVNSKSVEVYTDEIIEVLSRKFKANPCLIGEAGVGKTSIVHAFVKRIVDEDVPDSIKGKHVCYINGGTLTAGTRFRGDFEERMKLLMDWASKSNVILFLDEIHTFMKSGSDSSGAESAGNIIKKYLSDGSIKVIGTTTLKEYHKFIEQDSALSRRLQNITVKEPTRNAAISMIKGSIKDFESFHSVKITNSIVERAVDLSIRYIKDKALPDKAYTIIDQAAAKAKLQKHTEVTDDDILKTVSKITGIDIDKLDDKSMKNLMNLEATISKNLIGQTNAINTVSKAIRCAKADIQDTNKPLASFLFVGPTGVGKTELCRILSKEVAIGDMPLLKFDMSELSEKNSISKFIGSAPGYVGYGEGGQLTEKVKHNPYSLILFDEIEKAHPEVFNIFLQMLDEGKMTDGEGRTVDFTNCIIVFTSNAGYGADLMSKKTLGFETSDTQKTQRELEDIAIKALEDTFKPEFLNRLDNIVIFEKLTKEQCKDITKLMLNKLSDRLLDKNIKVKFNTTIINKITEDGYSEKYGARNIRREIQNTIKNELSEAIISGKLCKNDSASVSFVNNKVKIDIKKDENVRETSKKDKLIYV